MLFEVGCEQSQSVFCCRYSDLAPDGLAKAVVILLNFIFERENRAEIAIFREIVVKRFR
ncbi:MULTISPECIES: hypothetical protein [unclassified Mesorhizobium]|uniref:hypothetical protein n=1 Tax=unclassified Mesorhizobium TaxID=325217 RepID=UPI000A6A5719|nr:MULTISPECIES: hypothetical protein [unclassified Mesorhizobium]